MAIDPKKLAAFANAPKKAPPAKGANQVRDRAVLAVLRVLRDTIDAALEDWDLPEGAGPKVGIEDVPGNPEQPEKGIAAMREAIGPKIAEGLTEWAKGHGWDDFMAVARTVGAEEPERFAAWLHWVKHKGGGES